jgi:hypothetical protein
MPFVGRESAIIKAWEATVTHFENRNSEPSRYSHGRLFAVGGPGIGKTAEFDQLLLKYGEKI